MKGQKDELGVILKNWKNKVPVCVVYPDSYYTGMSNLAVHLLYKTLNDIDWVVCERAFFSERGDILTVETKKRLKSFEILFFTISYELHYLNVIKILVRSGITLKSWNRENNEPIVVGGGINVIANPEPLSPFFDLFVLGDIEATIPQFMELFMELRGKSRKAVLEGLSSLPFVYNANNLSFTYDSLGRISSINPSQFKVKVEFYRGESLSRSCLLTKETEFKEMYLVEGTRGCPSSCPFCLIGNIYDFVYDRMIHNLSLPEGIKEVGLIGAGISFHPSFKDVVRQFVSRGIGVHLPSLRIDKVDFETLEFLKGKLRTITFGIEAASLPLRKALGKLIGDEDLLGRIDRILDIGDFNFKLYFMIGLPGEDFEDVQAIVELTKRIRHLIVKKKARTGSLPRLTVHVNPFVPKPMTPFQWVGMEDLSSLEGKLKWLKGKFSKVGNVVFTHESVKYSFLQASFARADRRISDFLVRVASGENIRKASIETHMNLGFYALRNREIDEILPWDFIDLGITKETLLQKLNRYFAVLNRSQDYV